jgi:hypothetical protein
MVPRELQKNPGTTIDADLILPSGAVRVLIEVQRSWATPNPDDHPIHTLAAKFKWLSADDSDALDAYLYGSNAEWRLSGLREKSNTPIEWLRALGRRENLNPLKSKPVWQSAILVSSDFSHSTEVLATYGADSFSPNAILTNRPLKRGEIVVLMSPTGDNHVAYCKIESVKLYQESGRNLFFQPFVKVEPQRPIMSRHSAASKASGVENRIAI